MDRLGAAGVQKAPAMLHALVGEHRRRVEGGSERADTRHEAGRREAPRMHELILAQARTQPERLAVDDGSARLTYGELAWRARRLGRHLRALGVGSNTLVGVFMNRRVELIIGMLATLEAGGAYVPLDPTYPAARLESMLHGAELKVVLTTREFARGLPGHEAKFVFFEDEGQWSTPPLSDRVGAGSIDDLCYGIYTSGSTGNPKLAGVTHRGWCNLMYWFSEEFGIGAQDRVLVMSSVGFDITQRAIVMPLITGGELHLYASKYYDPEEIAGMVQARVITRINCAPSTFYPLVEGRSATDLSRLGSLKTVFLGGEAISATRLRAWAEGSDTEVINVYGVAECSDVSSFYRLRNYRHYAASSVPIGKPIFNSRIYLVDEALGPVGVGASGELCIAGDGVGAGYLNDEEMTAEKFVSDPFGDGKETWLYRTGDLARINEQGELEFVGRVDHQVKLRGFRVHLGDVEHTLRQCELIREAVVLKTQEGHNERLIAFVVPKVSANDNELVPAFHRFSRERLPTYMVPAEFVILESLPLSPNGKVDRSALLSLDRHCDAATVAVVEGGEPKSELEKEIAPLICEALGIESVGVDTDFFEVGGDSLKAVQVVAKLGVQLGVSLPMDDFFEARTLRAISVRVARLVEERDSAR